MNEAFGEGFAGISVAIVGLLVIIYFLRVVNKTYFNNENILLKTGNRFLRKYHKLLGIALIITGVIHGVFSSQPVLSPNIGTAAWVLSIILGLNFMFRKSFKKKGWIYYHRVITVLFIAVLIIHIATA